MRKGPILGAALIIVLVLFALGVFISPAEETTTNFSDSQNVYQGELAEGEYSEDLLANESLDVIIPNFIKKAITVLFGIAALFSWIQLIATGNDFGGKLFMACYNTFMFFNWHFILEIFKI